VYKLADILQVARFEVLTVVTMKITVFWDVTPCRLVDCYRRFGDSSALNLEAARSSYGL
jgi:hypothetical protein